MSGRSLTLTSANGSVGTIASPLTIAPHVITLPNGSVSGGIVNIQALGDIGLKSIGGDLEVGSIATDGGDVAINVTQGSILDASGATAAQVLSSDQIQAVWQRLHLVDDGSNNDASVNADVQVGSFQTQVVRNYQEYMRLLLNGSASNGVYTLADDSVALYRQRAAAAFHTTTPSDTQVKYYAGYLFEQMSAFFDNVDLAADAHAQHAGRARPAADPRRAGVAGPILGANWRTSAPFQLGYDTTTFTYTASQAQHDALVANVGWTENELRYAISSAALGGAGSGGTVGQGTPNVSGHNVTLQASGGIGRWPTASRSRWPIFRAAP